MLPSEREMVRKLEEDEAPSANRERFTSLQPTYEDSVPPSAVDDESGWDDRS